MDQAGSQAGDEPLTPAQRLEQNRREGRGRLSSIDMLPEEADPAVIWALAQLRDHKLPQNVIFAEFNEKLADLGITPISKSSWSRYAVRKALAFRKLDELRRISAELKATQSAEAADDVTVVVGEMLKMAVYEKLEADPSSKDIRELSGSLNLTVSAQRRSAQNRRELEKEQDEKLKKKAAEVNAIGKKAGVSAETLAEINRVLGVG